MPTDYYIFLLSQKEPENVLYIYLLEGVTSIVVSKKEFNIFEQLLENVWQ